jgi:hypothetical protein
MPVKFVLSRDPPQLQHSFPEGIQQFRIPLVNARPLQPLPFLLFRANPLAELRPVNYSFGPVRKELLLLKRGTKDIENAKPDCNGRRIQDIFKVAFEFILVEILLKCISRLSGCRPYRGGLTEPLLNLQPAWKQRAIYCSVRTPRARLSCARWDLQ